METPIYCRGNPNAQEQARDVAAGALDSRMRWDTKVTNGYIRVCMYIFIYVYIHIYVYECILYIDTHTYIYIYTDTMRLNRYD